MTKQKTDHNTQHMYGYTLSTLSFRLVTDRSVMLLELRFEHWIHISGTVPPPERKTTHIREIPKGLMRPYLKAMRCSALGLKIRDETTYQVMFFFYLREEIAKTKGWFGRYKQQTTCPIYKVNLGGHVMTSECKPEGYQGKLHQMRYRHWGENMGIQT